MEIEDTGMGDINYPAAGSVDISGVVQEGSVLTAITTNIMELDGIVSVSYRWELSDNGTNGWAAAYGIHTEKQYSIVF